MSVEDIGHAGGAEEEVDGVDGGAAEVAFQRHLDGKAAALEPLESCAALFSSKRLAEPPPWCKWRAKLLFWGKLSWLLGASPESPHGITKPLPPKNL